MLAKPLPSSKPICPFFYECGGCDSQDVLYADQIAYKDAWLKELFTPLLKEDTVWQEFIGSPEAYPLFFRNKIRYGFIKTEGHVSVSRHRKGEDAADLAVDKCFLQSEESVEMMNFTAKFAEEHNWSIYNPATGQGWLKHLLIRQSKAHNTFMVSLVTDEGPIRHESSWLTEFRAAFPMATSLWQSVSWGKSNERIVDRHLYGEETITDKIGEYSFLISPQAFFQTNGSMVETLYSTIRTTANLKKTDTVWDLYAGSATIGIYLSEAAKQVLSIESNRSNIIDARANLGLNKVENLELVSGKVEEVLTSTFIGVQGAPDVIVVDPPRAGLHQSLRRLLPHVGSHRLLYVSCNPLTCVRDVQELVKQGYNLKSVRGIDMFPHTWHCEVLVELTI
jgi:23S rRNA (uracil1939-C5)-methyltransferase